MCNWMREKMWRIGIPAVIRNCRFGRVVAGITLLPHGYIIHSWPYWVCRDRRKIQCPTRVCNFSIAGAGACGRSSLRFPTPFAMLVWDSFFFFFCHFLGYIIHQWWNSSWWWCGVFVKVVRMAVWESNAIPWDPGDPRLEELDRDSPLSNSHEVSSTQFVFSNSAF